MSLDPALLGPLSAVIQALTDDTTLTFRDACKGLVRGHVREVQKAATRYGVKGSDTGATACEPLLRLLRTEAGA